MSNKITIEIINESIKNRPLTLLSRIYERNNKKLLWLCNNNQTHQWLSDWNHIQKGRGCPYCSNNQKLSLDEVKKRLITNNIFFILLSTKYVNNNEKLLWECKNKHQWKANWNCIQKGRGCPYCSKKAKPLLEHIKAFIKDKPFTLLSTEYKNAHSYLKWLCNKGHIWEAKWNNIQSNSTSCPECSRFKTETLCKQLLEDKLKIPFLKTRFTYNNKRYEFDGYNEEHRIAFEYHGYQHYIYPNFFHKTKERFLNAQNRDKEKEFYCLENNIKLIIIPYTANKTLVSFIKALTL